MPKMYPGYREEVRKKIIAEASSIFLSKGYSATTMDEIAARLGVTKAAIYQYYDGKADLFAAVAEFQRQQIAGFLDRCFTEPDFMRGAAIHFDMLIEFVGRSKEIYSEMSVIALRDKKVKTILQEDLKSDIEMVRQFIEKQKARGLIHSPVDSRTLAVASDALINGLMYDVIIGMDPAEAKKVWLNVVDDLFRVHEAG